MGLNADLRTGGGVNCGPSMRTMITKTALNRVCAV